MINQSILVGTVSSDVSTGGEGKSQFARFRMKTWEDVQKNDGDTFRKFTTHTVTCWGKQAAWVGKNLADGVGVSVGGRYDRRKVEKDGEVKYYEGVVANSVSKIELAPEGEKESADDVDF